MMHLRFSLVTGLYIEEKRKKSKQIGQNAVLTECFLWWEEYSTFVLFFLGGGGWRNQLLSQASTNHPTVLRLTMTFGLGVLIFKEAGQKIILFFAEPPKLFHS
jgi:hypothetical protein